MRKLRAVAITAFLLFIIFIAAILIIPFVANSDVGSQWLWQKGNLGTPLGSDKIYIERKSDNLGLVRGLSLDDHYNWLTGKLVVWPMGNCKTAKTEAELIALKDDAEIVVVQAPITLTPGSTLTTTCALYVVRGCPITTTGATLTVNGPFEAGPWQCFSGTGEVVFGGSVSEVIPEWWETSTSDTSALGKAVTACGTTHILKLGARTYTVTSTSGNYALTVACSIIGESPNLSKIYNDGTGSALLITGAPYYSYWKDFSVLGNANSEDGITTSISGAQNHETAYARFHSVDSHGHGRHGLVHRMAWGTRYFDCKFYENGGLGVYVNTQSGDYGGGGANGVSFFGCESRWNGGTADASIDYLKGGVRIIGGQAFSWIGGVVESNNAWGFIVSEESTIGCQNVSIRDVYFENHPLSTGSSTEGGHIRSGGTWNNLSVENCLLPSVALSGVTSYAFHLTRSTGYAEVHIRNNRWYAGSGGGTETQEYRSGNLIGYMKFSGSTLPHYYSGAAQSHYYGTNPVMAWEGNTLTLQAQDKYGAVDIKKSITGNYAPLLRMYDASGVNTIKLDPANKAIILKDTSDANFYYLTIEGGAVKVTLVP